MKKIFAAFFSVLALLMSGTPFVSKEPEIKAEAVSTTRLYIVVTDDLIARTNESKFILWTGKENVDLALLSTVDSKHNGDIYTYYTDATITNTMTFKNNGGSGINLYNISNSNKGTTWDKITFSVSQPANFNGAAVYTTSVYVPPTPPGAQYTVSLYNGETIVGTQTAYEGSAFTPQNVTVTDHVFEGWYTDALLTSPYTPTVLTANTSLYGKYIPIDLNRSIRIYIASDYSWWYDAGARIDLFYWKTGVTAQVITMRKEDGNLHSAVIPNATFTHIKLERKNPVSPFNVWNATGDIQVNLLSHNVIKFSGPLNGGYTGPFAVTNFSTTAPDLSTTAPDIAYLTRKVPELTCSNYTEANGLLGAYNRLGDNELELIDALTTPSHDEVPLTYKSKIDYYVSYAASITTTSSRAGTFVKSNNSVALLTTLGLGTLVIGAFYFAKKKKSIS